MRRPKSRKREKRSRSRSTGSAAPRGGAAEARDPAKLALLPDDALLEAVQRRTFRYFWEAAHPVSGLAFDRRTAGMRANEADPITIGGSGTVTQATARGVGVGNLSDCIERNVRRWRFPSSGGSTQMSFPVVFQSTN